MVDLWDALALVAVGGILSLGTGIVIQILSTRANRESEERQAKWRVEEEQRQAKRKVEEEQRQAMGQFRQERMRAVLDFLDVAKRFVASRDTMQTFEKLYAENAGGLSNQITLDELRKGFRQRYPSPSSTELANACYVAMSSAAPGGVVDALIDIMKHLQPPESAEASVKVKIAIGEAEKTVAKYIVETESENG